MSANSTSELDLQSRCVTAVGRGHAPEPPFGAILLPFELSAGKAPDWTLWRAP
jgi:hypothetical protein